MNWTKQLDSLWDTVPSNRLQVVCFCFNLKPILWTILETCRSQGRWQFVGGAQLVQEVDIGQQLIPRALAKHDFSEHRRVRPMHPLLQVFHLGLLSLLIQELITVSSVVLGNCPPAFSEQPFNVEVNCQTLNI